MEKSLPSLGVLFQESWSRFTKHIPSFLIFQLAIPVLAVLALIIPAILIGFLTWKIAMIITILVLVVVFVALIIILLGASNALIIRIGSDEKIGVKDALKKGVSFIIPTLVMGFFVGLLQTGSFFLFIVPGIIVSFFLGFYMYEILIEGNRWMQSVKNSATIFKQHAWEITGRILLWVLITMGVFFTLGALMSKNPTGGIFVQIMSYLFGWYGLVYSITLYKQARAATNFEKPAKLTWIYVVSVVGWIFGFALLFLIVFASISMQPALEKAGMDRPTVNQQESF